MLRLTGVVVRIDRRSGNTNGRDWQLNVCRVLVAGQSIVEMTYMAGDRAPHGGLAVGQIVDCAVAVAIRPAYRENPPEISYTYDGDFPTEAAVVLEFEQPPLATARSA